MLSHLSFSLNSVNIITEETITYFLLPTLVTCLFVHISWKIAFFSCLYEIENEKAKTQKNACNLSRFYSKIQ